MKKLSFTLIIISMFYLTACAHFFSKTDDDASPYEGMTAETLFKDATKAMKKKEYATAAKRFEALEAMYPFSEYTEESQLNLIYVYYQNDDYASAAATAERFTRLYPRSKHVDYAFYMKGLSNFQQTRGAFAHILPLDESWRDPGTGIDAYNDFSLFVQRFPNSPYRPNAQKRLIYLRNVFAQREYNIATYYFKKKMYVAAIERADFTIKNYAQAPVTKDAMILSYKANKLLGLTKALEDIRSVYRATYHSEIP